MSSFADKLFWLLVPDVSVVLQEIRALRADFARSETRRLRKELDCWHSNARTVFESSLFKENLAHYYQCTRSTDDHLKCMVTGAFYPRNEVRASHIVKQSTDGMTMHLYGLPPDIDHVKNGLLLLEPIEQAFARKDICFLYHSIATETAPAHSLTVKVLDPNLLTQEMPKSSPHCATYPMTYGSIDGSVLLLPPDIFPYRRALSMHAKFALSRALNKGWITDELSIETYFSISDEGLQEPLGLGNLTWKEVHVAVHNVIDGLI